MHAPNVPKGKPTPCVGVRVRPNTFAEFESLTDELMAIGTKLGSRAQVQFVTTRLHDHTGTQAIMDEHWPQPPMGGASIAPVGAARSGSLGGYMMLGGKDGVPVFMTAAHVVQPADRTEAQDITKNGFERNLGGDRNIAIQYPAKSTIVATMEDTKLIQLHHERTLRRLQEAEMVEGYEGLKASDQQTLAEKPSEIEDAKNKLAGLERILNSEQSLVIGSVIQASPIVTNKDKFRMDWALVELNDRALFPVNASPDEKMIPHGCFTYQGYKQQRAVDDIVEMKKDQWCIMQGATSKIHIGTTNGIETILWMHEPQGKSNEWEIFQGDVGQGRDKPCFGAAGDSGAWLYDSEGKLLGMYWGGGVDFGCATPMLQIVEDIKTRTGKDISLSEADRGRA